MFRNSCEHPKKTPQPFAVHPPKNARVTQLPNAAQMGNHLVSCCGCNAGDDFTAVGPAPTKPTEADEEDRRQNRKW